MSSKINTPVTWKYRGGYYSWKLLDADGKETGITTTREIKELAIALNFHPKLVEALNVLNDAVDDTLAVVPTSVLKAATRAERLLAEIEAAEEVG